LLLAGLIALVHLAVAFWGRIPGIAWGEDDAQYLTLARELTHFSYRDRWDIHAPVHVRYPPMFPAMLALVGLMSGWSVDAMLFVIALCSTVAIVVFFDAARRAVGDELAILVALLWAMNPWVVRESGWLLSETLFNLCFAVALWGITREHEGRRYAIMAGIAVIAAAMTRTAGAAFIAALFAYWVWNRSWKRAGVLAVASSLTLGLWLLAPLLAADPQGQRTYLADLALLGAQSATAGAKSVTPPFVLRVAGRGVRMATTLIPVLLSLPTIAGTLVDNILWLAVFLATSAIGVVQLLRRWLAAGLQFVAYMGLLLVWTWTMQRYYSPMVPLLYLVMLAGTSWLAWRFIPRWRAASVLGFASLLLAGELPWIVQLLAERSQCDRNDVLSTPCHIDEDRQYLTIARWVRDSTPTDAVVLVNKEAAFYVHTGRRSVNQIAALRADSATIIPFLRKQGVSYVVVSTMGIRALSQAKLMEQACQDLILVKEFPDANAVLRVRGDSEPSDGGAACRVLAPWRDRHYPVDPQPFQLPGLRVRS